MTASTHLDQFINDCLEPARTSITSTDLHYAYGAWRIRNPHLGVPDHGRNTLTDLFVEHTKAKRTNDRRIRGYQFR